MICPDHTIENSRAGSWLYLETLVFLGLTLYHADVQLPMGRGSDNSDVPIQLCGSLVSNIPWYSPIFIGRKILVEECLEQQLASQWRWLSGKNLPANAGDTGDVGFHSRVGKIPWRRALQPTPVFLEISMDRGSWTDTVDGVSKSWTWLSGRAHRHARMHTQYVSQVLPCLSLTDVGDYSVSASTIKRVCEESVFQLQRLRMKKRN